MPEFRLVQNPDRSPTSCIFCGDFAGPFIDPFLDLPGYGAVFVCCENSRRSGCLTQMAQLAGMASATEKQDMYDALNSLETEVSELEREVESYSALQQALNHLAEVQARKLEVTADAG